MKMKNLKVRAHEQEELSHYSQATSDFEYLFPIGWSELEGVAHRGNFDLTQHAKHSGKQLSYFDEERRSTSSRTWWSRRSASGRRCWRS